MVCGTCETNRRYVAFLGTVTGLTSFFLFLATTAEGKGIDVMDPSTAEKLDTVDLELESKRVEV